ncbi:major facilitator superfamily domain-containing protein 6-like [Nothobranchius furzeri]|uniref:Major facilitator superfamily domain containing 6-like n=2 Tax=Nothobranchius furzeri TaxID=105023 RepID=A0A8C6MK99_NOTFU|nr:major facilitator superfamily domain containing 6-like [Nothobranchius furzeri]
MRRTKQIDIKRALALAGTFSFLCSCAKACLLPFLTLYFRQLGLSPMMTGMVMGTKHLLTLVWSPAASLLSKHYNKRRVVITCSLVFSAAAALLLLVFPPVGVPGARIGSCNTSSLSSAPTQRPPENTTDAGPSSTTPRPKTVTTFPSDNFTDPKPVPKLTNVSSADRDQEETPRPELKTENGSAVLNVSHGGSKLTSFTDSSPVAKVRRNRSVSLPEQLEEKDSSGFGFLGSLKEMDSQSQLFFLVLIIVSVWELMSAPLDWTVDDGLYEYLDLADASDRHGSTEVWGLLGAACGVGGTGLLVSQLSCLIAASTSRTAVHFFCYAGLVTAALPVAVYLPLYLNKKRDRAHGLMKAMQLVHGSPHALLCAVTVLLVGAAGSAVENFLLWQMQDHGSSELHMGLSLSLALLSQASFPLLSGRVSKLLSPGRVLVVGVASLTLQCFYYAFLWGPWAAMPAQVLSSLSSGALWWSVSSQCEDVATPGAERGVWRFFSSLCLHLGAALGSLAGGFVVQRFGVTWLFLGVALGLVAWCVCLPVLQWKAPRQRRINYSRLLTADASEASDSESEQDRDWLDKALEDDRGNNNYERRINH